MLGSCQRNDFIVYSGQGSIPRDVTRVKVHPSVKVIHPRGFYRCSELTNVELPEGLKEIGEYAFYLCLSLHAIVIPPFVKVIDKWAFTGCVALTNVELPEGLEEIREEAFCGCRSLHRIVIPQSVTEIDRKAFSFCHRLMRVEFCEEIESFVSGESMRDWWFFGVHEKSLSTYCFFARCNIPERIGLVQARKWQIDIHEMLKHIPSSPPRI
jgi:hypothetical protein